MSGTQSKAIYLSSYPDNLCERCRGVNAESLSSPEGVFCLAPGEYVDDGEILRKQECPLCKLVMDDIGRPSMNRDPSLLNSNGLWLVLGNVPTRLLTCVRTGRRDEYGETENISWDLGIDVRSLKGDPSGSHGITLVENLTNTGSDSSLAVARGWIEDCNSHHECISPDSVPDSEDVHELQASPSLEEARLGGPSRLIDLEAFVGNCMDAKLIDTGTDEVSRYATLSYCWGTNPTGIVTTTTHTLASRKERIEYSLLPLTLQHTLDVTRKLAIRYIWIDALCILQDSISDWTDQSAKMGTIYGNSFLTIAADWGSEVTSGLFSQASDKLLVDRKGLIRITSLLSHGLESTLYLGSRQVRDFSEIHDAVLATRAWALQERLLSPRILHFAKGQLFWECKEQLVAQDRFHRNKGRVRPLPGIIWRDLEEQPKRQRSTITNGKKLCSWYSYVISENYAARRLTVPSDKLSAVSALAKVWAQYMDGPYLAGLWRYYLPWGLAWRRERPRVTKSEKYRAPSWSWASLDCDLTWDFILNGKPLLYDSQINIEHAGVDLIGNDPYGQVDGGRIIVSGFVQRFRVVKHVETTLYTMANKEVGTAYMDTNTNSRTLYGLLLLSRKRRPDCLWCWILLLEPVSASWWPLYRRHEPPNFVRVGVADYSVK